jgi:hypothetical protein
MSLTDAWNNMMRPDAQVQYAQSQHKRAIQENELSKTKYIINGWAQHGKDTFADALASRMRLKQLNASMWYAEKVVMPAFPGAYSCVEDCYNDRVNRREMWYHMMRLTAQKNPEVWTAFMQVSDIYCGHRNISEHTAMINSLRNEGFRVKSLWIEREGMPKEDSTSCEFQTRNQIDMMHGITIHTTDMASVYDQADLYVKSNF